MKDFAFDGTVKHGRYSRLFEPDQEGMRAWYFVRLLLKGQRHISGPPSIYWHAVIM